METGKKTFFTVELTTIKIGNLTRLIYTLLYVMTILTADYEHVSVARQLGALKRFQPVAPEANKR